MALDGITSERAKHTSKLLADRQRSLLPRERPTIQQRYASYDRKMGGLDPFEKPSMRRSAPRKKNAIFAATKRNSLLTMPTKQLNNRASQVRQVPRALIEEHMPPPQRAITSVAKRSEPNDVPASKRMAAPDRLRLHNAFGSTSAKSTSTLLERENRLRALKSLPYSAKETATTYSIVSTQDLNSSKSHAEGKVSTSLNGSSASASSDADSTILKHQDIFSDSNSGSSCSSEELQQQPQQQQQQQQQPQPIRRVIVRKRPAPTLFLEPKKKKTA